MNISFEFLSNDSKMIIAKNVAYFSFFHVWCDHITHCFLFRRRTAYAFNGFKEHFCGLMFCAKTTFL